MGLEAYGTGSGPFERCSSRNARNASKMSGVMRTQVISRPVPFGTGSRLQALAAADFFPDHPQGFVTRVYSGPIRITCP